MSWNRGQEETQILLLMLKKTVKMILMAYGWGRVIQLCSMLELLKITARLKFRSLLRRKKMMKILTLVSESVRHIVC